ncbi:MAG: hypothetical protein U0L72_06340 [Acutalibacteraceae bacterium]|nr:hypothetical protein [Acutalibacteraceae bacterium]
MIKGRNKHVTNTVAWSPESGNRGKTHAGSKQRFWGLHETEEKKIQTLKQMRKQQMNNYHFFPAEK